MLVDFALNLGEFLESINCSENLGEIVRLQFTGIDWVMLASTKVHTV